MKVLKKILIVLGILIAIPLIAALFVPKKYTVSVSTTINKPGQVVYDYVRILKNQEQYSEWLKPDPNLHPTITGVDGTVGAKQIWDSKNDDVGAGEQTITNLSPERMDIDLKFLRPFEGHSKAANIFKAVTGNQTILTSEFYADEKYPLNLMSYLFGRPMIEETQSKNLKNIKEILESK
ncbi:MAG: SRPBCC family protein [Bacteroidota bacterium]